MNVSNGDFAAELMPLRIGVLMDHPSPHMSAFLDALARRRDLLAHVFYCRPAAPERTWTTPADRLPTDTLRHIALPGPAMVWNPGIGRQLCGLPRFDVWLINTCYTSMSTQQAIRILHRRSIPWVYMNEPPRPSVGVKQRLQQAGLKPVLRWADGFVGMGGETARRYAQLADESGRPDVPTVSVPYYIDVAPFLQLAREPIVDDVRFVCVAQLIPRKGLDVLLDACRRLPSRGWDLTIFGAGPLREELESRAANLANVRFAGTLPYEARTQAFAGRHVFVFPSRWDGFGMVIPEALAAGLPAICTDQVMSAHDFLKSDENGFIGPADDVEFLADRMQWCLDNRDRIGEMSHAARRAVSDYRPELGAEFLVKFLRELVQPGDLPPTTAGPAAEAEPTWAGLNARHSLETQLRQAARRVALSVLSTVRSPRTRRPGHRVLVYHLVLRQDRRRFREHLRYLKDHFRVVGVDQLPGLFDNAPADDDWAAVTFDDGFRILMDDCLEVLAAEEVPATFFIPTGFVETADDVFLSDRYSLTRHHYRKALVPMRPEDLQTLVAAGHGIGSHTVSHANLQDVSAERAQWELERSRQCLEQWTGRPVTSFAYPYGHLGHRQAETTAWLQAAGYRAAFTLQRGPATAATNPYCIPREHAEGCWTVRDVACFLNR
jgi:glycosyltransferase involved in cell wall biosynthesis/peptidoglycan/xylan/chitin deacetylase (PgdA/CDA1 family)